MKRKQYSLAFEMFWKSLDSYFPKGSKVEAYREFQKLECNQDDAVWIAGRYNDAVRLKRAVIEGGGWSAPLKHVCRYLKNEDFDLEISEPITPKRTKDSERRREYAEFFQQPEADMGEGLGDAGSEQVSTGTSNIVYFPLLDEPGD